MKGRTTLAPAKLEQLAWIPFTTKFCYVANKKLVVTNASNMKMDSVDVLASVNKQNQHITGKTFPQISWVNDHAFYFRNENMFYSYDLATSNVKLFAVLDTISG